MADLSNMIIEFEIKIKEVKANIRAAKAEGDWPTYNSLQKRLEHLEKQFERTKQMNG